MKSSNSIRLIVVSHQRAQTMTTLKHVPGCEVCIPESQYDEYKKFHPDAKYLLHPDSVVGLSPKRQWIYEKVGNTFFLDDDITGVSRIYQPNTSQLKPDEIFEWIQTLSELCIRKNIKLFGFSRSNHPKAYPAHHPIEHNIYITGGAFGILEDENLYFPNIPDFVGEDYWINALNAYFNRFSYVDQRIAFSFAKTEGNPGGVAHYRTEQKRKETFDYLRRHFGDAIQKKRDTTIKKRMSKHEKFLRIPY